MTETGAHQIAPSERRGEAEKRDALLHALRVASAGCITSNLVHDLSQPLTAINAWATACLKLVQGGNFQPERLVERLTLLQQESWRATEIIRSFRRNLDRQDPVLAVRDANAILSGLAGLLKDEAARHGVGVDFQLAAGLPSIQADVGLVELTVFIICRNSLDALKYGERSPKKITVKSRPSDSGMVEVIIADNGPGLDPKAEERLFRPFAGAKTDGMGVGLAICRTAIEALGGRIWLERNTSEGTAFAFALPCAPNGGANGATARIG